MNATTTLRMLPALAASLLCVAMAGCAGSARKGPALGLYAKNPFAPVNLFVNANEHLGGWDAELVEHIAAQLESSEAFLRVDRGVQRWPATLQLRYSWEHDKDPADVLARVGSYLTLGLIPMRVRKIHRLEVDIFLEPEPIASLYYTEAADEWVSLYALADANASEREAVNRLIEKMMAEISSRKLVPRARDVPEPDTPPPRKRRKQPV